MPREINCACSILPLVMFPKFGVHFWNQHFSCSMMSIEQNLSWFHFFPWLIRRPSWKQRWPPQKHYSGHNSTTVSHRDANEESKLCSLSWGIQWYYNQLSLAAHKVAVLKLKMAVLKNYFGHISTTISHRNANKVSKLFELGNSMVQYSVVLSGS